MWIYKVDYNLNKFRMTIMYENDIDQRIIGFISVTISIDFIGITVSITVFSNLMIVIAI